MIKNNIFLVNNHAYIETKSKTFNVNYVIVDVEDLSILDNEIDGLVYLKRSSGKVYCVYNKKDSTKKYRLHRLIANTPMNLFTDHINNDSLDNRKNNLRNVTKQENSWNIPRSKRNTSGFHGVSFDKRERKYAANITIDCVKKFLGNFSTPEQAHEAYLKAKEKYHSIIDKTSSVNS